MKTALLSATRCCGAMLVGLLVACAAAAQSGTAPAASASASVPAASGHKASPFRATKMTANAKQYYASAWGVDKLKVSYTQSGNLIRFSYRVAVPEQARMLADKSATPYLFGQKSRAMLQIPVMDKVGQLRQTAEPKAGQEYWMVFSNKGNLIKPGDRVNVVIGTFHADGLVVD